MRMKDQEEELGNKPEERSRGFGNALFYSKTFIYLSSEERTRKCQTQVAFIAFSRKNVEKIHTKNINLN